LRARRWAGAGYVEPTGSAQSGRKFFFSNSFLMPETIPENLEIVFRAPKILEKSQKF
jgi:hypothetical protein